MLVNADLKCAVKYYTGCFTPCGRIFFSKIKVLLETNAECSRLRCRACMFCFIHLIQISASLPGFLKLTWVFASLTVNSPLCRMFACRVSDDDIMRTRLVNLGSRAQISYHNENLTRMYWRIAQKRFTLENRLSWREPFYVIISLLILYKRVSFPLPGGPLSASVASSSDTVSTETNSIASSDEPARPPRPLPEIIAALSSVSS